MNCKPEFASLSNLLKYYTNMSLISISIHHTITIIGVGGEPAGIRTQDTRIKSPMLCQTELPARNLQRRISHATT